MADFSEDESDPEMAEDLEDDVPELEELEEILEELFESEESEENATLTEPAEDEPLFDLEVEPVSMNEDPYDHPTMPSLSNITTFTKVPNVEIVGQQIPMPRRTRMYGNATKPVAEAIPSDVCEDKLGLFKFVYDNDREESILDMVVVATNIRKNKIYPSRPKGNDPNDIYYAPITKKCMYNCSRV